jgi:hypothetical protein
VFEDVQFAGVVDGPSAVGSVGFIDVDQPELGDVAEFLIEGFQFANLAKKGRSRIGAENQHHRPVTATGAQVKRLVPRQRLKREGRRELTRLESVLFGFPIPAAGIPAAFIDSAFLCEGRHHHLQGQQRGKKNMFSGQHRRFLVHRFVENAVCYQAGTGQTRPGRHSMPRHQTASEIGELPPDA